MANQSGSETVIPFAKNTVSNGVDQLDAAWANYTAVAAQGR